MDALKILGGLLNQRAGRPGAPQGGGLIGQVLNGVASAAQQNAGRPVPPGGSIVESLVRDSIMRHHHAGGQLAPPANNWVQGYPYGQPGPQGFPGQVPPGYQEGFPPGYAPGYMPGHQPTRGAPVPDQNVPRDPNYTALTNDQRGEILIQAMIMAAQADGSIDADEQNRIIQQLQPLTQAEITYLNRAFATRHDVEAFVNTVPRGMEHEVYQISMMAINLDNQRELQYLRNLAAALRIAPQMCNQMHAHYGMPGIF